MSFPSPADLLRILWWARFSPARLRDLARIGRLAEGVCGARTVAAGLQLGLFSALQDGPGSPAELAQVLGVPGDRLRVVLDAGIHYGLLAQKGSRVAVTRLARRLADAGDPMSAAAAGYLRANAGDGEALVRSIRGEVAPEVGFYERMGRDQTGATADYCRYMAATAAGPAAALADAWNLAGARRLLDVGGGFGHFSRSLLAAHPSLEATVVDLPEVCAAAAREPHGAGSDVHDRLHFQPLDFRRQPLPEGQDAVLYGRVLHDWDRDTAARLLAEAHAALRPGGQVAIFEILRAAELGNPPPVILAAWEVVLGAPGEIRTADHYRQLLAEAGFRDVEIRRPFDPVGWNSLITAVR